MSSKLVLWKLEIGPPSWAVRMLGDILGLQFELNEVDFMSRQHKTPEYLKLNPMGTIPVLEDGDFVISESHTIMKYLLAKYGDTKLQEALYPSELRARALVDQAMFFDTGVAFVKGDVVVAATFKDGVTGMTPELIEQMEQSYDVVERYLERNRFVAGERVTLADISLGATINTSKSMHDVDPAKFPLTVDWLARLEKEPFFKKIVPNGRALCGKWIKDAWEENRKKQSV